MQLRKTLSVSDLSMTSAPRLGQSLSVPLQPSLSCIRKTIRANASLGANASMGANASLGAPPSRRHLIVQSKWHYLVHVAALLNRQSAGSTHKPALTGLCS